MLIQLTEEDRLQGALYQSQARAARAELRLAEAGLAGWNARVAAKYALAPGLDSVNTDTGEIWRHVTKDPTPDPTAPAPTTP